MFTKQDIQQYIIDNLGRLRAYTNWQKYNKNNITKDGSDKNSIDSNLSHDNHNEIKPNKPNKHNQVYILNQLLDILSYNTIYYKQNKDKQIKYLFDFDFIYKGIKEFKSFQLCVIVGQSGIKWCGELNSI